MEEPAIIVQKAYAWNLWVLQKTEKFPRSHRFSVGQMLTEGSLRLLMHVVDATFQKHNSASLLGAVKEVNRMRYLVRLSKDLGIMTITAHEFSSKALDEIGRMAGGWLKSATRKDAEGDRGLS